MNPYIESGREQAESQAEDPYAFLSEEDQGLEQALRPSQLSDFQGQDAVCERLQVMIEAAKQRGDALGHCLFCGPPGLGKTTLAMILAQSMGTQFHVTSGPVLEKAGDLAGILSNLKEGDVLFIDEIHRLSRNVEEYLYPAMEDFSLDLMIDSGPGARSVQIKLKPFTLVGATTRQGLITGPLRSRFGLTSRLDYYDVETLTQIIERSAKVLEIHLSHQAAQEIAKRSRGTPRIANNLIKWVRDYSQTRVSGTPDIDSVKKALDMLAIDSEGLDEMDRKLLNIIIKHYNGGPVGLNTLALAAGEEPHTLEEVYEPYLILKGFLKRMPRGRAVTTRAYSHLHLQVPEEESIISPEGELFL